MGGALRERFEVLVVVHGGDGPVVGGSIGQEFSKEVVFCDVDPQ